MRPVKQDRLYSDEGIGNGNCLAACYASLLDMPLWMVPPFDQMFGRGDWAIRRDQWLERLGYELEWLEGHQVEKLPEFYIASGMSARGVLHAVIYSAGELLHDPHFSGLGIETVKDTYHLVRITK
ncbi:MAG: hypothetical protein WA777_20090 [Rhodanobacter sp.]